MERNIKRRWIRALRSGKYQQTRSKLRQIEKANSFSFCCLGVLCDIQGYNWAKRKNDTTTSILPRGYAHGLDSQTCSDLANMNDSGRTFLEIANWIEYNVPGSHK